MHPTPDGSPPADSPVERLAMEYFSALDAGERPVLARYLERLDAPADREQLAALAATGERIQRILPLVLRSGLLLAGRYQLVEEIGTGGQSSVWSARDQQLGRTVAVKLVDLSGGLQPATEFFLRERTALARVRHPGIVTIHDAHQSGGHLLLVMDHVPGVTLTRVLEQLRAVAGSAQGRVPTTADLVLAIGGATAVGQTPLLLPRSYVHSVARIVVAVLQALEAAHNAGVVHRDLKPGNVLLLPGGHPAVLDFGLAGFAWSVAGEVSRRLFGSPGHVAPEQITQLRTGHDVRLDVYQAGLMLYELLTLQPPFPRDTSDATLDRIRAGDTPAAHLVAPWVPPELAAICRRAMAPVPDARYASARAFREDLERFLAGRELPIACRGHASWRLRLRYLLRRRGGLLLMAALFLGGLAAVLLAVTPAPILVVREVQRQDGAILVATADGSARAIAGMLVLERDGRTFYVPLHAAPGQPAQASSVRLVLPAEVPPGVLAAGAGVTLAAWHAPDAAGLGQARALLTALEDYLSLWPDAAGVPGERVERMVERQREATRGATPAPAGGMCLARLALP